MRLQSIFEPSKFVVRKISAQFFRPGFERLRLSALAFGLAFAGLAGACGGARLGDMPRGGDGGAGEVREHPRPVRLGLFG